MTTLDDVIDYMETTRENEWLTDRVRSDDGTANCFFGHLFAMGRDDDEGTRLWNWFESAWSTEYRIYPVNDGNNPRYQQATPKQRVLAYLRALRDGNELTTMQSMEADYMATGSDR